MAKCFLRGAIWIRDGGLVVLLAPVLLNKRDEPCVDPIEGVKKRTWLGEVVLRSTRWLSILGPSER